MKLLVVGTLLSVWALLLLATWLDAPFWPVIGSLIFGGILWYTAAQWWESRRFSRLNERMYLNRLQRLIHSPYTDSTLRSRMRSSDSSARSRGTASRP